MFMIRASWNNTFKEELKDFPNGKFDDQVDAASIGHNELIGEGKGSPIWGRKPGSNIITPNRTVITGVTFGRRH
jgi:hypothetical protein